MTPLDQLKADAHEHNRESVERMLSEASIELRDAITNWVDTRTDTVVEESFNTALTMAEECVPEEQPESGMPYNQTADFAIREKNKSRNSILSALTKLRV